jgi:hypothetical protein
MEWIKLGEKIIFMKKTTFIKKTLLITLILLLVYTIYKQYQVENYISNQKQKYGILKNKKRINYIPFVIHFFSGAINNSRNKRIESKAFFTPYDIVNVSSATTDKDFDSYMVYCYFTKEEIEKNYIKYLPERP